jgi:hypothetical protein
VPRAAERLDDKVATQADPAQQYALYFPDGASARTPLLIVLDPRGRGAMARDLVLDGARARGWAVMASWQSRSDTQEGITLRAIDALAARERPCSARSERVYLAGMSGTAKTLWVVQPVLHDRIAGLIGSGGARPPELPALARRPTLLRIRRNDGLQLPGDARTGRIARRRRRIACACSTDRMVGLDRKASSKRSRGWICRRCGRSACHATTR